MSDEGRRWVRRAAWVIFFAGVALSLQLDDWPAMVVNGICLAAVMVLIFIRRAKRVEERSLLFVVLMGLAWGAIDAFYFRHGVISGVLCLIGLFYLLPRAVAAWKDPPRFRVRLWKALATTAAGVAAFAIIFFHGERDAIPRPGEITAMIHPLEN